MATFLFYAPYFVLTLFGVFLHFLKKKVRGESATEIKNYFSDNFKSTLVAIGGAVVGFALLVSNGEVTWFTSIGAGYLFDSVLNKWDAGKQ